jgi:hypothetical protein
LSNRLLSNRLLSYRSPTRDRQRFRSTKPFAPSADPFVRTLGERDPELRDAQVITRPGHE